MEIAILGAGALGSILAALLAQAGEDVTLLARGDRARFLERHGVRVQGLVDVTAPVRILTRPSELARCNLLINTVKTYDTAAALEPLRQAKIGSAISVQNGVLKDKQLSDVFGEAAVLGAVADFSGEVLPDGSALFTRNVGIYVGELPEGVSPRVESVVAALKGAGVNAIASGNIQTITWSKFVAWVGLMSVSVLSRQVTHRMMQDPDLARLQAELARETGQIAAAQGIAIEDLSGALMAKSLSTLPLDEATKVVQAGGAAMEAAGVTAHKMSALQDAERERRLEVEETLGYVLSLAEERGISAPVLATCYRLLAGINRGFGG